MMLIFFYFLLCNFKFIQSKQKIADKNVFYFNDNAFNIRETRKTSSIFSKNETDNYDHCRYIEILSTTSQDSYQSKMHVNKTSASHFILPKIFKSSLMHII